MSIPRPCRALSAGEVWLLIVTVVIPASPAVAEEQSLHDVAKIPLTVHERQWLAAHPVIRLAPDPDFPPIEYFNAAGEYDGLAADYVALIEHILGIRFEIVRLGSWDDVLRHARSRQIDMLGAAMDSPQRSRYMLFTRSHIELPGVIIVRNNTQDDLTMKKLKGMKVAVVSGYVWEDLITNDYPDIQLNLVPDIQTGLRKVSFGMVDAMVGDPATTTYYIQREGITNLHIAGDSGYRYELALSSRRDWPQLHTILEKAMARISAQQRRALTSKWIRLQSNSLFTIRNFWIAVLSSVGVSLLMVSVTLMWNRSLKRQVGQRTNELAQINDELKIEVEQRKKLDDLLSQTQAMARVGGWEIQLPQRTVKWTNEVYRIHELSLDTPLTLEHTLSYYHPDSRAMITQAMQQGQTHGKSWDLQLRLMTAKQRLIWVRVIGKAQTDIDGCICRLTGTFQDITDRVHTEQESRQLEQRLRHSQKMEAVGQLAAGVSHEFNNILVGILCNADLLLTMDNTDWPDDVTEALRLIKRSGNRAAALTRQLLAFSRKRATKVTQVDLNGLISEMKVIIQRILGGHIRLILDLSKKLWTIQADLGEIEQIVINLIVNSRDAMPNGGKLTLKTANVSLDQDETSSNPDHAVGSHVVLSVIDVGHGMSVETTERVFEPFFTTKPTGRGTGLGLSTVYGLVEKMGGQVKVNSSLGIGTAFHVYLPQSKVNPDRKTDTRYEQIATPMGRNETILVCDDDAVVRDVTSHVLKNNGYTVITAADGHQALSLVTKCRRPISLLLTDVVMPGVSGQQLAKHTRRNHPGVKVIYMSGYIDPNTVPDGMDQDAHFIEKPFLPNTILRCIHNALSADQNKQEAQCTEL